MPLSLLPIAKAKNLTAGVLAKGAFWRHLKEGSIKVSERQRKIINLLLDDYEGKLTTEKWRKLAKISHDTALRDIQDLIEKGFSNRKRLAAEAPRTFWFVNALFERTPTTDSPSCVSGVSTRVEILREAAFLKRCQLVRCFHR